MINRAGAEAIVAGKALKLQPGQVLWIATFKQDRCIEVRRGDDDTLNVRQNGFQDAEYETDPQHLKKLLKALFKREFPRSNKLHLRLT